MVFAPSLPYPTAFLHPSKKLVGVVGTLTPAFVFNLPVCCKCYLYPPFFFKDLDKPKCP